MGDATLGGVGEEWGGSGVCGWRIEEVAKEKCDLWGMMMSEGRLDMVAGLEKSWREKDGGGLVGEETENEWSEAAVREEKVAGIHNGVGDRDDCGIEEGVI